MSKKNVKQGKSSIDEVSAFPSAKSAVPDLLEEVANAKPEDDEVIQSMARQEKVGLIAFIAPYVGLRVSPTREVWASIGLVEEFGIEVVINSFKKANIENIYLMVNSPGGEMPSSYKIARVLKESFKKIISFVPHIAASGGTILALTGNQIVMGPISHITPLDVQIRYKDQVISANTFMRFFTRASEWFETSTPGEAPYPYTALADRLDPFLMEEWSGLTETAIGYVEDILTAVGYKKPRETAEHLVTGFQVHEHVILRDKAREIGLNVVDETDFSEVWPVMKYWLGKYLLQPQASHCIRFVIPKTLSSNNRKADQK